jgi:hypothetical protein
MGVETGEHTYVVPAGDGVRPPIVIDLKKAAIAEARLQDVAIVNKQTASELLSTYNDIWLKLQENCTKLAFERDEAKNAVGRTRAEALLGCNDDTFKKMGHAKGSADLRNAVVDLDLEVRAAEDRLNQIRAVLAFLEAKAKAFENAYNSVKALVRGQGEGGVTSPQPLRSGALNPHGDLRSERPSFNNLPPGFDDPTYQ